MYVTIWQKPWAPKKFSQGGKVQKRHPFFKEYPPHGEKGPHKEKKNPSHKEKGLPIRRKQVTLLENSPPIRRKKSPTWIFFFLLMGSERMYDNTAKPVRKPLVGVSIK